jgi:hypothetical protein
MDNRMMIPSNVPTEIWSRIFGDIGEVADASFLLSLAIVCKLWTVRTHHSMHTNLPGTHSHAQEPALDTLHAQIKLNSIHRTVMLARSLVSHTNNRGRLIRHLVFALPEPPDSAEQMAEWMGASQMVLLRSQQLESFRNEGSVVPCGSHIASIPATTLRAMDIVLRDGNAISVLPILSQFSHLKSLELNCVDEMSLVPGTLDSVHPLTLPTVNVLVLKFGFKRAVGLLERYLFRCRFPTVAIIKLSLPHMTDITVSPVISFLGSHRSTCQELHTTSAISFTGKRSMLKQLSSQLMNTAHKLVFEHARVPARDLFNHWTTDTKMTCFHIRCILTAEAISAITALMEEMSNHDFRPSGLKLIIGLLDEEFTWGCGARSRLHAELVGVIVHHALQLASSGVTVQDEMGQTFTLRAG